MDLSKFTRSECAAPLTRGASHKTPGFLHQKREDWSGVRDGRFRSSRPMDEAIATFNQQHNPDERNEIRGRSFPHVASLMRTRNDQAAFSIL